MHITQESDYALRIVYCLAKSDTRRDARAISEEMCVTLRFSLKILGKLVQSGLVSSYKGNRGGYELAKKPNEITLSHVISAVEGTYKLSRCLDGEKQECNRGASGSCAFQHIFADISGIINDKLSDINFEDIINLENTKCKKTKLC